MNDLYICGDCYKKFKEPADTGLSGLVPTCPECGSEDIEEFNPESEDT